MKNTTIPKRQLWLSTILGLVLCGALPWPVHAQDETSKSGTSPVTASDPWKRTIPKVGFDGIPLYEVVGMLSDWFPEINFVTVGQAEGLAILCDLRSVGLADILKVIELHSNGSLRATRENERLISFAINDPPLTRMPPADHAPPVCRVFNLSRYMEGKSPEELDRAIAAIDEVVRTSLEMMARLSDPQGSGREQMPAMSVHRETKLLIVVGRAGPSMEVVEQVVQALQGSEPYGGIPRSVGFAPGALPPRVPSVQMKPAGQPPSVSAPELPAPPSPPAPPQPPKPSSNSTGRF